MRLIIQNRFGFMPLEVREVTQIKNSKLIAA